MSRITVEQKARDLLARLGVQEAHRFTAGDLVELANLFLRESQMEALVVGLRRESLELSLTNLEASNAVMRCSLRLEGILGHAVTRVEATFREVLETPATKAPDGQRHD